MRLLLLLWLIMCIGCANPRPVTYQPLHNGNNFDVYYAPNQSQPNPTVILIHGGAWYGGDKAQMDGIAYYLNSLGYTAISVNYRLAPVHIWPVQLNDVTDVYNHLLNNPSAYNIDAQNVFIAGISAGAQLSLMLGYTATPPRGIMAFSGETDLTLDPEHVMSDYDAIMTGVLGHARPFSLTELGQMSPINFVKPEIPLLLVHARHDKNVFVTQSDVLYHKLTMLNGKISYVRSTGDAHSSSWKEAQSQIADFINRNLQ